MSAIDELTNLISELAVTVVEQRDLIEAHGRQIALLMQLVHGEDEVKNKDPCSEIEPTKIEDQTSVILDTEGSFDIMDRRRQAHSTYGDGSFTMNDDHKSFKPSCSTEN